MLATLRCICHSFKRGADLGRHDGEIYQRLRRGRTPEGSASRGDDVARRKNGTRRHHWGGRSCTSDPGVGVNRNDFLEKRFAVRISVKPQKFPQLSAHLQRSRQFLGNFREISIELNILKHFSFVSVHEKSAICRKSKRKHLENTTAHFGWNLFKILVSTVTEVHKYCMSITIL